MDARGDGYDVLSALTFVAGLVLVPVAFFIPAEVIDASVVQPVRDVLHSIGLAAAEAEPGLMPLVRRTSYVRMPALFLGALCVVCNLYLFRNPQCRDRRPDVWRR
jgi:hypothetical protein